MMILLLNSEICSDEINIPQVINTVLERVETFLKNVLLFSFSTYPYTFYPYSLFPISFPLCGKRIVSPLKDVYVLITRTCEYVMLCGKEKLKLQMALRLLIDDLEMGRLFWII